MSQVQQRCPFAGSLKATRVSDERRKFKLNSVVRLSLGITMSACGGRGMSI